MSDPSDNGSSRADGAREIDARDALRRQGSNQPESTGEPPVDRRLLTSLVRNELSAENAKAVARLIIAYPEWRETFVKILDAELHERS